MRNVFNENGVINSDLFDLNKQIYVLFSGVNAKIIFFLLLQYRIKIRGFVVKEKQDRDELYGLPFISIELAEEDSFFVTDTDGRNMFQDVVCGTRIYLLEQTLPEWKEFTFMEDGKIRKCNAALMITMILSRVHKRQAVFLINSKDYDFWRNLTNVLENEVKEPLIIAVDKESETIYDLAYCDIDRLIVFISVFECSWITEILIEMGLKQTQNFVYIHNSFSGNVTDKYWGFDWLLGNTFKQELDCPGFYIHGDKKGSGKKIVLLGNSASDPLFYPQKSWPEMFCENCQKHQVESIVYNGAVTDYSSINEMIKLLRDALLIKPDIVISYSGIIDFREYVPGFPYLNLNLMRTSTRWESENDKEVIYGLADNRSAYERWISNEKIMNQVCQIQGISFYGILQPWLGSDRSNAWEKLQMWSDYYWQVAFPQFDKFVSNAKEFKRKIQTDVKENEWLYDFTNIFSWIDDDDIYFDSIHVNEQGNQIVAEKIGELLELY